MLDAARAMKLSAKDLLGLNIIDEIIPEPVGGAHRDKEKTLENIKFIIKKYLDEFENLNEDEIVLQRKNKFLQIGRGKGFSSKSEINSELVFKKNTLMILFEKFSKNKKYLVYFLFLILVVLGSTYFL